MLDRAYKKYSQYFHNPTIQENIKNSKEEEYQGIFLTELKSSFFFRFPAFICFSSNSHIDVCEHLWTNKIVTIISTAKTVYVFFWFMLNNSFYQINCYPCVDDGFIFISEVYIWLAHDNKKNIPRI